VEARSPPFFFQARGKFSTRRFVMSMLSVTTITQR
jgi:hypothetical protein